MEETHVLSRRLGSRCVRGQPVEAQSEGIATGVLDLVEEMTRHRPARARVFLNDDVITIVVDHGLTQVEKALAMKDVDAALNHRRRLQKAICARVSDLVEELTDCRVLGCLADHAVDPDVGVFNVILDGPTHPGAQPDSAGKLT
jgi:uncharacterized protein YbcI